MKRKFFILFFVLILVVLGVIGIYKIYRYYHLKHLFNHSISLNETRPIDELKELVLCKGDTAAYDELRIAYLGVKHYEEEYLLYSMIMANKYKYRHAYFYVYFCLTNVFEHHHSGSIDEDTKTLALEYLKKGVELRDWQSTNELSELYLEGKYVAKDTLKAKQLSYEEKFCK